MIYSANFLQGTFLYSIILAAILLILFLFMIRGITKKRKRNNPQDHHTETIVKTMKSKKNNHNHLEQVNSVTTKYFNHLEAFHKFNYSSARYPDHYESLQLASLENRKKMATLIRDEKHFEILLLHHYIHSVDVPGKHFKTRSEEKNKEYPIHLGFILVFQPGKQIPDELAYLNYDSRSRKFGRLITHSKDILDPDFNSGTNIILTNKLLNGFVSELENKLNFHFGIWFKKDEMLLYLTPPSDTFELTELENDLKFSIQVFKENLT